MKLKHRKVVMKGKALARYQGFMKFVDEVERQAKNKKVELDRARMMGYKSEFIEMARNFDENLSNLGDARFAEYFHALGIKFPSSRVETKISGFYKELLKD